MNIINDDKVAMIIAYYFSILDRHMNRRMRAGCQLFASPTQISCFYKFTKLAAACVDIKKVDYRWTLSSIC